MKPKQGCIARAAWLMASSTAVILIAGTGVAFGMVQRRASTDVPAQQAGSATAECEPGQVALAAGFAAPGWDPTTATGGPVARFTSMPAGKRGVKTSGFNFGQIDSNVLESYAYCGKRAHPPQIRSKRVQVAPGTLGSVTAECPQGSQAISGGFESNRGVITLTSKRAGERGWTVERCQHRQLGERRANLAGGLCVLQDARATMVTVSKDATVGAGFLNSTVRCPDNGKALAGGFDGHVGGLGEQLNAAGALDSKRTADGHAWTTSSLSVSAPSLATITTYAYCRD